MSGPAEGFFSYKYLTILNLINKLISVLLPIILLIIFIVSIFGISVYMFSIPKEHIHISLLSLMTCKPPIWWSCKHHMYMAGVG
jgi:hypothetical protein